MNATVRRRLDLTGRPGLPAELATWVARLRLVPADVTPPLILSRDGERYTLERPRLAGTPAAATRWTAAGAAGRLRALLVALAAFHAVGLPHANLKPGNLIDGPDGALRLLDPLPSFHPDLLGTTDAELRRQLEYGPPEAAVGLRATPAGDLYRAGLLVHVFLTGENPFRHVDPVMEGRRHLSGALPDLAARVPGLPARLVALVERLTAADPAERPADAAAALALLDSSAPIPPPARPRIYAIPEPPPPEPPAGMRRVLLTLLLALALSLLVLGIEWARWEWFFKP